MQGLALDTKWAMTRQLVLESLLRRSLGQKSATYLQAIPSILQVMLQAKASLPLGILPHMTMRTTKIQLDNQETLPPRRMTSLGISQILLSHGAMGADHHSRTIACRS